MTGFCHLSMKASYMTDFFIFTQARLASQRLPNKMVRDFSGRSLWDIACEKLHNLPYPKEMKWVSIYDQELKDIAARYDISIYERSYESANNDKDVSVIWEICGQLKFDRYVMFNPCLPLLSEETIIEFIEKFKNCDNSLFGVKVLKDYLWNKGGTLIHPYGTKMFNSKEFDEFPSRQLYMAAHCLYAGKCSDIMNGIQLGDFSINNPELYPINNKIELFDVDDIEDFEIAEAVYEKFN